MLIQPPAARKTCHLPRQPIHRTCATAHRADRRDPVPDDEACKTTIVRFGNRLRIAGTAEFGDRTAALRTNALRTLPKVAADWFPGAARYSDAQFWTGIRPTPADGPPLLGHSRIQGLCLNVGHGAAGWALACGSGKLVADLVAGREPDIPLDGLALERYR